MEPPVADRDADRPVGGDGRTPARSGRRGRLRQTPSRRARRPLQARSPSRLTWALLGPLLAAVVHLLYRVEVVGAEHLPRRGAVVVAPNHVSYLDPVVMLVVLRHLGRRARFLAVAAAFRHPVAGWAMRSSGMIPVERGRVRQAMAAARAALAQGGCVVAYPEGTIPAPGAPRQTRGAAGALRASAPVVPVGQWGMQRGPSGWTRLGLRRPAAVVFGPPLPPEPDAIRAPAAASARVLDAVEPLVAEARQRVATAERRRRRSVIRR